PCASGPTAMSCRAASAACRPPTVILSGVRARAAARIWQARSLRRRPPAPAPLPIRANCCDSEMTALTKLVGPAAPLLIDNINPDLIAPMYRPAQAGILRGLAVKRSDLAGMLFASWRYDTQDRENPEFVLNRAPFRNARFLLAGANFGCGS